MAVKMVKPASASAGARRANAVEEAEPVSSSVPQAAPNPEVSDRAVRRQFTAKYKLSILQQVDACKDSGGIGVLLRREGLYSSHLTDWRRQRDEGSLAALTPKQRGRRSTPANAATLENERLRKDNARLERRLKQAELIIDIQKKVSQVLGITLTTPPDETE